MKKKTPLEKLLEAMPDKKTGVHIPWTMEQDSLILRFCDSKGCEAVAKILGITSATIRKRFAYLKTKINPSKTTTRRMR